ncbi:MAG: hypothetical protein CK551_02860 [Planctomycetaceae bacterium]|nr:MAG: hypothetical protein CK551_02860 [Planctomycetaceae bacterium]
MVPQKEFDLRCNLPKVVAKYNTLTMIITKGCVEITKKILGFSYYYDRLSSGLKLENASGFVLCLLPSLSLKHNH